MEEIVKDSLFELAERYVNETGVSVFLTGRAGTGKTTFLRYIREHTSKRCVVLAPTGIAAINAGGVTIHSFFQLPLCPYLPDVKELVTEYQMPERFFGMKKERLAIIRTLDLLIIDEISMVRADLLDAIDMTLRRFRRKSLPFGGVQLLMIGDANQLSPVVTEKERPFIEKVYKSPYFFESKALQSINYVTVELKTIHRQKDPVFIDLLNRIRVGSPDYRTIQQINSRYRPDFIPDDSEEWIRLTTHNYQADKVNASKLDAIESEACIYEALIEGNFPSSAYPVPERLPLKVGEQVMFVRNDSSGGGRWYNGRIGVVQEVGDNLIVYSESEMVKVERETWADIQYELNKETGEIEQRIDGTFSQIPLRPAWAVTIHKSQGLTFDRVIIDAAQAFAFGQVYVALSRCRTFDGIVLSSRISSSGVRKDADVSRFSDSFASEELLSSALDSYRRSYFRGMMRECFDFGLLASKVGRFRKIYSADLSSLYPSQTQTVAECYGKVSQMENIGKRFAVQISEYSGDDASLNVRAAKAADYYLPLLESLKSELAPLMKVGIDNEEVRKTFKETVKELSEELSVKTACMDAIVKNGFSVDGYARAKTSAMLGNVPLDDRDKYSGKSSASSGGADVRNDIEVRDIYKDNSHPELVEKLILWRREKCREQDIPAYIVLHQKTLLSIADLKPQTPEQLLSVPGFGKAKLEKYGDEILAIMAD